MNFRANDPGSVQYGNFINYYQFNSAEERIRLLPTGQWKLTSEKFIALDIGCNSGDLTQLLYEYLKANVSENVHILGIDIDPILVDRARENNARPLEITYECVDFMHSELDVIKHYLSQFNIKNFHAVFCLSVTMWIHLNHGDEGLKRFLRNCVQIAETLLIEPQPWKCYQNAVKRLKKGKDSFPHYQHLKWRTDVEEKIQKFLEIDLKRKKIYETNPTKWKRKICFYSDAHKK